MEPTRNTETTLVDLLDRILDKGIMLDTDLIIHIAGIPLLGIKLKTALAGMQTMLDYGMWKDWDEAQRMAARDEIRRKGKDNLLREGEEVIIKMFGSEWHSKGIWHNWRPGHIYVTNQRVFLYRKEPSEILFETRYEDIKGYAMERKENIAKKKTDYLYLFLKSGGIEKLHPTDASTVKKAIEEKMKEKGLPFEEIPAPVLDDNASKFLVENEELVRKEKMWYLMELPAPGGTKSKTWKAGYLYLTNQRLLWWYDFDGSIALEVELKEIKGVRIEKAKEGGGILKVEEELVVRHEGREEYFSGNKKAMQEWEQLLSKSKEGEEGERETCPHCGKESPVKELLERGCIYCGWVSPRVKRKMNKVC
ncbi:MAG: gas vesicle protein [Candidatus Atribacteria bacterium]|nr:gas vesicle protein [Candidatus Atribacteria bacterium]